MEALVHLRDAELLAEMFGIFVDGEAGREGRDLEQDAARLAEVDRAEVVAVEDLRHIAAGLDDPAAPLPLLFVAGRPGDVVDGARARNGIAHRRVVGPVEVAALSL